MRTLTEFFGPNLKVFLTTHLEWVKVNAPHTLSSGPNKGPRAKFKKSREKEEAKESAPSVATETTMAETPVDSVQVAASEATLQSSTESTVQGAAEAVAAAAPLLESAVAASDTPALLTPEEIKEKVSAHLAEVHKLEGDKLKFIVELMQKHSRKIEGLKRVVVSQLLENEKAPQESQNLAVMENFVFQFEYFPGAQKKKEERKDFREGRRSKGRDGKRGRRGDGRGDSRRGSGDRNFRGAQGENITSGNPAVGAPADGEKKAFRPKRPRFNRGPRPVQTGNPAVGADGAIRPVKLPQPKIPLPHRVEAAKALAEATGQASVNTSSDALPSASE